MDGLVTKQNKEKSDVVVQKESPVNLFLPGSDLNSPYWAFHCVATLTWDGPTETLLCARLVTATSFSHQDVGVGVGLAILIPWEPWEREVPLCRPLFLVLGAGVIQDDLLHRVQASHPCPEKGLLRQSRLDDLLVGCCWRVAMTICEHSSSRG